MLTGPIPSEIGNLKNLNQLSLQVNRLNSFIPQSLSNLKFLNVLNLSNNLLTGEIPESLCGLLPNSLDFSNNQLSGPVPLPLIKEGLIDSVSGNPGLCVRVHQNKSDPILPLCRQPALRKRLNHIWVLGVSSIIAIFGILLLVKRCWWSNDNSEIEQDRLSSSSSFDVTSFHKLSFDQHEIVEALIDKNIVGHGGSGTVYKIELSNGEHVAVKKLWSQKSNKDQSADQLYMSRELRSEVKTLGSIRHKNIVKLYCCFSSSDSNLLVYEYMPNGNLWDALHKETGWSFLDWPTRHRIAVGIAQGLAYLHHDLLFPIVHRDVKTSNILLDAEFEPKVADFGVAKVLQAGKENDSCSTTVIAGTCGYLAPEYAYSSRASTKCDVYSFGVVLMEIITGKKPSEPEFGENKDIIHWVSTKMAAEGCGCEVLDKRLSWSPFKEEMLHALRIALRCTCTMPAMRPSMNEVVQLLVEGDHCKSDSGGSSFKLRESSSFKIKQSPAIKSKIGDVDMIREKTLVGAKQPS
ncbi:uncharacterized protein A4U43_C03F7260 [Asparagus officinalis]|uniref:Protein kinase domain-containing protein n=2 Tax=Asparagus officinalis TaxID=4686 RepID=A0A5P1F8T4_ASPOF|nr:uncharacterized protein A4U43_C03F7260 [Asparagus officinalis]